MQSLNVSITLSIEVTDTFGGEANYCWVKRGTTKATSRRGIIAAVKRVAGWTDWCRVKVVYADYDMMEIRPVNTSGICQVAFVNTMY
jgi:hypothetical protein